MQQLLARHYYIELKSFNWKTLEERRRMIIKSTFHQIKNNRLKMRLPPYIKPSLRKTAKYHQLPTRIFRYKYSFYPSAILIWNLLPCQILCPIHKASTKYRVCSNCSATSDKTVNCVNCI